MDQFQQDLIESERLSLFIYRYKQCKIYQYNLKYMYFDFMQGDILNQNLQQYTCPSIRSNTCLKHKLCK